MRTPRTCILLFLCAATVAWSQERSSLNEAQHAFNPAKSRAAVAKKRQDARWSSIKVFQISPLLPNKSLGLDLNTTTGGASEEITVYDARRSYEEQAKRHNELSLGAATLSGDIVERGISTGMTITAAVPILGIPGLDAVVNLSGGHDQVNASRSVSSGAVIAGIRLTF